MVDQIIASIVYIHVEVYYSTIADYRYTDMILTYPSTGIVSFVYLHIFLNSFSIVDTYV